MGARRVVGVLRGGARHACHVPRLLLLLTACFLPFLLCPPVLQVVVDKWNLQITDVKNPEEDVRKMLAHQ